MGFFDSAYCESVKANKEKLTINAIFVGAVIVGAVFNVMIYYYLYLAIR